MRVEGLGFGVRVQGERKFIDYTTSMITDEDPLRGLVFYWDLGFSHTLHVLKERRRRFGVQGSGFRVQGLGLGFTALARV